MSSVHLHERAKGIAFMMMACFAVGIIETATLALAPLSCPPEDLGVALGALGSFRSAGGSICSTYSLHLPYLFSGVRTNID